MARVRITKKVPKALSGLEMKMSAGLYGKGTNGNSQFRKNGHLEAGKISQQPTEVRDSLQPVAREDANLEAERGETAMVNIDGIPAHFKIGGKRHSEGGTPLNLPDNSFIFSDTAKMKIKDPIMLAQFGMVPKKSGYTPAEIAKKYDINKFRQVLADPNSEDVDRSTAELMISNYNMKLAKLALVQESSKGFPQGIPVVAMPYVMASGMNPEELLQVDTQGQEEQSDEDMGVSRYGGGLMRAQTGLTVDNSEKRKTLEAQERSILKLIEESRKLHPELTGPEASKALPKGLADSYEKVHKQLSALGPDASTKKPLTNEERSWVSSSGTRVGDPSQGAKGYWDRVSKNWSSAPDIGNIDPQGLEFASNMTDYPVGGYQFPNLSAQQARSTLRKVVHPSEADGVLDYAGNLLSIPGKGTSGLLTGNIETAGETYLRNNQGNTGTAMGIDFLSDPTTYLGAAPLKGAYIGTKNVVKQLPKAYAWARYLVPEYYTLGKEFAVKYGKKALDAVENLIKDPTFRQVAENVILSGATRVASAGTYDKYGKDISEENEKLKQQIANLQSAQTTPGSLLIKAPIKPKTATIAPTATVAPVEENWDQYEVKK
jgi:hypothetical protein